MSNVTFTDIPEDRVPTKQDIGKQVYNRLHDAKRFTIKNVRTQIFSTGEVTMIEAYDTDQKRYTFAQKDCKLVE